MPASSASLANLERLFIFVYEKNDANVVPLKNPAVMATVKQLLYACVESDCSTDEKEQMYKEAMGLAKRWRMPAVKGERGVALDTLIDAAWMPFLCRAPGDHHLDMVVKALTAHLAHANVHSTLLAILDARFSADTTDGALLDAIITICVPAIRTLITALVRCGVEALRATLARLSGSLATDGTTRSGKSKKRKRNDSTDGGETMLNAEPAETIPSVVEEVVLSANDSTDGGETSATVVPE